MSKITTFTTLAALLLSSAYLQIDLASARGRIMLMEPSQNAAAMNEPAQRSAAPASTTTFTPASPQFRPSMENFANTQSGAWSKPKYFIDTQVQHNAAISSFDNRSNINIGKFGALRNPAATGGTVPQAPTGTIYGKGNAKTPKSVSGFDNVGNGPTVNLPGGNAKGVKGVPGYDNVGNGPEINLPGGRQTKGSPADAEKLLAAQENANVGSFLERAAQGPDLNVPSQSSSAQEQSDGLIDSVVNFFTGGADAKGTESGARTNARATTTNANGEGKGQSHGEADQHTVVTSESLNGTFKDSNGNITVSQGYQMRDAFTGEVVSGSLVTIGPITITKSKYMPGDDTTGGPVDTSAGLAVGNSLNHKSDGGGTDNNDTSTSGGSGELDPGAPVNKLGNADGQGDDAGENNGNHVDDGAMASSALAKRQQVDGNDGRGARSAAQAKAN